MPRAPKAPGTAVDQRNGAKLALPGVALEPFGLPGRSDRRKYHPRVVAMWGSLWADERLAMALSPVDRELLVRWAQSVDDWIKATAAAWADPLAKGSMGQSVESPYFGIARNALAEATKCEQQIGIGALNRARLGIAILAEAKSLADLSAAFDGGGGGGPDPRLGLQDGACRRPASWLADRKADNGQRADAARRAPVRRRDGVGWRFGVRDCECDHLRP